MNGKENGKKPFHRTRKEVSETTMHSKFDTTKKKERGNKEEKEGTHDGIVVGVTIASRRQWNNSKASGTTEVIQQNCLTEPTLTHVILK